MPISIEIREFVKKELPYELLKELYKDSRVSLKTVARKHHLTFHRVAHALKDIESKYGLTYTLWLNERLLGFSEGRIITIKFGEPPPIDVLKSRLAKDIFVQNAYLASGDFDLLMHVVGLNNEEFQIWQFKVRKEFSRYKPTFKFSTLNSFAVGFLPLRNELIVESIVLSSLEKKILTLLNSNSRIRLKELVKATKSSQMRVIYTIKKLRERGIIRRFSTFTQSTDKKILMAYLFSVMPVEEHNRLYLDVCKEIVNEDLHEVTNDYYLISDINGSFDSLYMGSFRSGEDLSKRGSDLVRIILESESPKIEKAIITDALIGKLPLHLEEYESLKAFVKEEGKVTKITHSLI